ncbi:hypothetical protein MBLNU230_g6932t1 [Neophaeotheca triangularis]
MKAKKPTYRNGPHTVNDYLDQAEIAKQLPGPPFVPTQRATGLKENGTPIGPVQTSEAEHTYNNWHALPREEKMIERRALQYHLLGWRLAQPRKIRLIERPVSPGSKAPEQYFAQSTISKIETGSFDSQAIVGDSNNISQEWGSQLPQEESFSLLLPDPESASSERGSDDDMSICGLGTKGPSAVEGPHEHQSVTSASSIPNKKKDSGMPGSGGSWSNVGQSSVSSVIEQATQDTTHRLSSVRDFAYLPQNEPKKPSHVEVPEPSSCAVSPTPMSPSSPKTIAFLEPESPHSGPSQSTYAPYPLHRKSSTQPMTSPQIAAAGFEKHLRRSPPGTPKGAHEMAVDIMRQSSMNPESFVVVDRALRKVKKDSDDSQGRGGFRTVMWKGKDTQAPEGQSRMGWMRSRSQKLGRRRTSKS